MKAYSKAMSYTALSYMGIADTLFPHIVSAEKFFFEFVNPNVTVHKCAETIQWRKLYEEIRYMVCNWVQKNLRSTDLRSKNLELHGFLMILPLPY